MNRNPQNHPFFGHLFHSCGTSYYYEVSSQEIIALDPVMAAVLPHFEECRKGNVPSQIQNKFNPSLVTEAIKAIAEARSSDDLFSSYRPMLIPAPEPNNSPSNEYAANLKHLVLTLTEKCNLRCRYCLHGASLDWVRPHGTMSMSVETALSATRYFLARCCTDEVPAVSFYGGEALLQFELLESVVKEVRAHPHGEKAHLVIDTNGVLLDEAVIKLIVENKMYLQVSVDGPRDCHDRQRPDTRGVGTFDRIMEALGRLLELDPTAHERLSFICTVAPPADFKELDKFFGNMPIFARNGISAHPNLRINIANLNGQNWPATSDEFQDLGDQIEQLREFYFQEIAAGRRDKLGPVVKGLVEPGLFSLHHRSKAPLSDLCTPGGNCRPGIRKLHVTVDGRYQPCERTGDLLDLGNVENGIDPAAVINLQENFFKAVQNNCNDCWALRLCRVCYAGWAEQSGAAGVGAFFPESVCEGVRAQIEGELRLLVRILELPEENRQYLDRVVIV